MFHFQTLDVYKCAVAFLPIAYGVAKLLDGEIADPRLPDGYTLLIRVVSMLTKMIS